MEKIQYTQQEWASIIDDLGWNPDVMEELKQKGYIRKSAVENKVIFESEEQARKVLESVIIINGTVGGFTGPFPSQFEETIKAFKINGYIRNTAVEEAEEMYIRRAGVVDTLHITQQAAIQELKSEIARLKG
jgi:hypothetical protein